jgi:hypothetical protein
MKLLLATASATLIATVGIAGDSTRYEDLRLDTSVSAVVIHSAGAAVARPNGRPDDLRLETFPDGNHPKAVISTRRALNRLGRGFAYGGYGMSNDSR